MNINEELQKVGLTPTQYETCLADISDKLNGLNDMDWEEIKTKYNIPCTSDALRKANSRPFGGAFVAEYIKNKGVGETSTEGVDEKLEQLRKEKQKLQTLNIERNRIDRNEARQELFYENVGNMVTSLPLPEFEPLVPANGIREMNYVVVLADLHYGAKFKSQNNEYSREIFKDRLNYLGQQLLDFIYDRKLNTLTIVSAGDLLQGIIRTSDLKINDTEVVKCIVEISRILAMFLNQLSKYVKIEYYHVGNANHTQLRPIGTKANEIGDEDFEYVISHYIEDLCKDNERINIHLPKENELFIQIEDLGFNIVAMHGHTVKNIENSIRDLSLLTRYVIDYLILGHFHSGKEITSHEGVSHNCEVLVASSFMGSDPYSDRIMRGGKAAVNIYGFDYSKGHTETHKIILN